MSLSLSASRKRVPKRAGVGLKPDYYRVIMDSRPDTGFFEVHAENYMGQGGPPHRYLTAIADLYPISVHGVGLSIGGSQALDKTHLSRLKKLIGRYQPGLFSEHLAWSTHDAGFFHDLLPLPYTSDTLSLVCEHVDEVQATLGRQMLLENPSTYVQFSGTIYSETQFLTEVCRRTGCGLLLDINNVYVSSTNHQWDPLEYLNDCPLSLVQEIAGYTEDSREFGRPLLIDTHDRSVSESVWSLFQHVIRQVGPLPTLIEWDAALPPWKALAAEAERAEFVMAATEAANSYA